MAINYGHISGAEPSTVTFKAATITQTINSSVMHKEVIILGDPQSSIGCAVVKAAAPVSTEFGLVVRIAGGPSSAADLAMTASQGTSPWVVAGASTVAILSPTSTAAPASNDTGVVVRQVGYSTIVSVANTVTIAGNSTVVQGTSPWTIAGNSTVVVASGNSSVIITSGNSSVIVTSGNSSVIVTSGNITSTCVQGTNPWVVAEVMQSSVLPSSGSSGVIVRQVWDDRLTAKSTNAFASTSLTINSSAAGIRAYVTAYTITSTVAAATKIAFYDGSTMIWPIQLQAVSSGVSGANLSAYPYLFHGDQARALTLQTPSSVAGVRVGVSYFLAP